ncbi:programmed cell death protein 2 [Calycina marina]|uniref:Programmed cell death protein 2 n=1 Tax=Calycina marina TaxID=1763456 RepID=A0A9P7ZBZ0_9HELO|nr:programmed cell death protein 2 [Calycina marina]
MSESESSGDEGYTVTNVLLGYTSKEPKGDEISHLGGRPTWIDPSSPPSAALARCKACHYMMVLLLQLNGEVPEFPGHERWLYILTCRRKTCRRKDGSLRVLRGLRTTGAAMKEKKTKDKPKENTEQAKAVAQIGDSLFGAKPFSGSSSMNSFSKLGAGPINPFSSSSPSASTPSNPFAAKSPPSKPTPQPQSLTTDLPKTFASTLSLNNNQKPQQFGPPEPWPSEASLPPAYPVYYLDPDYEELDPINDIPLPPQNMQIDDSSSTGGGKEDKDIFESTIDSTFQKFADRLAQNPDQVLRYEFRGQPLLYSKMDAVGKMFGGGNKHEKVKAQRGMPRCMNCGAQRVFEVQLTPHTIMELEREDDGLDGMEWGTVIVGVCEKDCQQSGVEAGGVGYVEEWAGVQWEELSEKRSDARMI